METQARLYQRPEDRFTKPILSHNVRTDNMVFRITVPKRTGLKRKRGSTDCFEDAYTRPNEISFRSQGHAWAALTKDARKLLGGMSDNPTKYRVDVAGTINQTHRFHSLPDFVQSSVDSPFMQKMKDTILPFDYEKMKQFKLDMSKGVKTKTEIIPPPSWSPASIPFNYSYRQNPGVRSLFDSHGNLITRNTQVPPKICSPSIPFDTLVVPSAPPPELPPPSSLEPTIQHLIATMKSLMEDRPIFTRRSFPNYIPGNEWEQLGQNVTKSLFQYVGYVFGSGPWRDSIVKFGVDPRTDPKYRIYQTMMFVVDQDRKVGDADQVRKGTKREKSEQELRKESHLFDGINISHDGKVWQVCDVTDPLLRGLLATSNLRRHCHVESDGWYHNGTWSKVKMIMKYKIRAILSGTQLLSDVDYARVAASLPDIMDRSDRAAARITYEYSTAEEKTLASMIRTGSTHLKMDELDELFARGGYANEDEEQDYLELDEMDDAVEERDMNEGMQGEDIDESD